MRRSADFVSFNGWMLLLMYQMSRFIHREEILRLIWRWIVVLLDDGATSGLDLDFWRGAGLDLSG